MTPLGGACCLGLWPPSWWGVLCWCVAPLLVGCAVLLPAGRGGGAWIGLVLFGLGCRRLLGGLRLRLCGLLGRGWCCASACPPPPPVGACRVVPCPPLVGRAVSACLSFDSWFCSRRNARLALLVRCCLRRRTAGVARCWLSVVFPWPGLVLCWCMPPSPPFRGAVFVRGPPNGGACCVGVCTPHGGACGVGLWPPSWWGVLCPCVAPLLVGRAVLVPARRGSGAWFGLMLFGLGCRRLFGGLRLRMCCLLGRLWCRAGACPPLCRGVPCLCVPPPPGRACGVGVFGVRFVVL